MIYNPAEDSFLLEVAVKKYSAGKKILDMGTGRGIQAIAALHSGASEVLAADINPECANILKKSGISFIKSDLFSNVTGKFDVIAFNPPYLPLDEKEDKESSLSTTGGKKGDEIILKFLKQAEKHLSKNGIILLLVSSMTPMDRINKLLKSLNLKKSLVLTKKIFFENLSVLRISSEK